MFSMLPLALQPGSTLFCNHVDQAAWQLSRRQTCTASLLSPKATRVCLETLDPPQMSQFYVGTFPEECVRMMTMVRFWAGCSAVTFSSFVLVKL